MLLDQFFLRYTADTGKAVKDVDKLDQANEKLQANQKKGEKARKKTVKDTKADYKEIGAAGKEAGRNFSEASKGGVQSLGAMRNGVSGLVSAIGTMGPAAAVAVSAIAVVGAGIAIALSGINDARAGAQDAVKLGHEAFEARLSSAELVRMQNTGRNRGVADAETSASAAGANNNVTAMRAAQRQAARDPASAFNNPLIKQANLWKKAGVDISASLETQMSQQDAYLQALAKTGDKEKALVLGTQMFGRTLADVKAIVATANDESTRTTTQLAEESRLRRENAKAGESLARAETQLEIARKRQDERVLSKTMPATEEFTKAMAEWTDATAGLRDSWGLFVADLIKGMASLVESSTKIAQTLGFADRTQEQTDELRVKQAGNAAAVAGQNDGVGGLYDMATGAREKRRAEAEAAERLKIKAEREATPTQSAKESLLAQVKATAGVTQEELQTVQKLLETDPTIKTVEAALTVAREQLLAAKEGNKTNAAQLEYDKGIEANTAALINTGLEQAMSMWAAGVGRNGSVDSGGIEGETRRHYEERMRKNQRTINPNLMYNMSEDRDTLNRVEGQAGSLNRAGASAAGAGAKTITIGDIVVQVSGAEGAKAAGQEFGLAFSEQLQFAVNEFADPRVS